MVHYEIDFYFDGQWEHTCGNSSFPMDNELNEKTSLRDDVRHIAYNLVCDKLRFEHRDGYVDPDRVFITRLCVKKDIK